MQPVRLFPKDDYNKWSKREFQLVFNIFLYFRFRSHRSKVVSTASDSFLILCRGVDRVDNFYLFCVQSETYDKNARHHDHNRCMIQKKTRSYFHFRSYSNRERLWCLKLYFYYRVERRSTTSRFTCFAQKCVRRRIFSRKSAAGGENMYTKCVDRDNDIHK